MTNLPHIPWDRPGLLRRVPKKNGEDCENLSVFAEESRLEQQNKCNQVELVEMLVQAVLPADSCILGWNPIGDRAWKDTHMRFLHWSQPA